MPKARPPNVAKIVFRVLTALGGPFDLFVSDRLDVSRPGSKVVVD